MTSAPWPSRGRDPGLARRRAAPARSSRRIFAAFYQWLKGDSSSEISVAVRSVATAEDLPDASFAGQQETFLNVVGVDAVCDRIKEVFASLYNDRAIAYRVHKGFAHAEVALSAGVQRMVRSDLGAARRHVHAWTPSRASATWCSSPPAMGWARRWCRVP